MDAVQKCRAKVPPLWSVRINKEMKVQFIHKETVTRTCHVQPGDYMLVGDFWVSFIDEDEFNEKYELISE